MVFTSIFFVFNWFIGKGLVEVFNIEFKFITNIFAIVLGTTLNTLLIFLIALFFGLNYASILLSTLFLSLCSLLILYKKGLNIDLKELELKKTKLEIIFFCATIIFLVIFFTKSIYLDQNTIIAGNRLVWTDWPIHIAISSSFAKGDNFPPQNPQYANQLITYPFFSDFLSAILMVLGSNIKISFIMPAIVLSFSSICLLYYLGKLITSSSKIAILGTIIGLLWGGLGFIYFFEDLLKSKTILSTFLYPPLEYTFYSEKNLWFFTFLYSEILPQRAFLFGLPLVLISLILILIGLKYVKKNYLLLAGYIIGILPYFHMHSFISICIILFSLLPAFIIQLDRENKYTVIKEHISNIVIYLMLPIIGLFLIQLPFIKMVNLNETIGINLGWMKQNENFIVFWLKNTGIFIPLLLFSFYFIRKNSLLLSLAISISFLFIITNIFRFAPWPYDNLKIFTYWYLIGAFFVAIVLNNLYKKNILLKIISIILVFTLITSGSFEILRTLNSEKNRLILWQNSDFDIAKSIEKNTEPKSLILTASIHTHPATTLAGRRSIIGFPGNAWSWGMKDWAIRETDVKKMFLAQDERTVNILLHKYKVDYVLISNYEKNSNPNLNEAYYAKNHEFVTAGENFRLYKIL